MRFRALYARIYALHKAPATAKAHPSTPIHFVDFPTTGTQAEIHIGSVPDLILEGLRVTRTWMDGALRGGFESAEELRNRAFAFPESKILSDPRSFTDVPTEPHWYVTLVIKDHVDLQQDEKQLIYGVTIESWTRLDRVDFFERHTQALDMLSVRTAIAVQPYRYLWVVWDGPLVELPTGITLRPPRTGLGRPRVFTAPPIERLDLSSLQSPARGKLESVPMAPHFYLRAANESDRIERFFAAFRALEQLCKSLTRQLVKVARANCIGTSPGKDQVEAIEALRRGKEGRRQFATLSLALRPADADKDLTKFSNLDSWRNHIAHGNRKLSVDEVPDEEMFELLHKYVAALL